MSGKKERGREEKKERGSKQMTKTQNERKNSDMRRNNKYLFNWSWKKERKKDRKKERRMYISKSNSLLLLRGVLPKNNLPLIYQLRMD